jgi:hypothetical protein
MQGARNVIAIHEGRVIGEWYERRKDGESAETEIASRTRTDSEAMLANRRKRRRLRGIG